MDLTKDPYRHATSLEVTNGIPMFKLYRDKWTEKKKFDWWSITIERESECNVSIVEKWWKRRIITAKHCLGNKDNKNQDVSHLNEDSTEDVLERMMNIHKNLIKHDLDRESDLFIWDLRERTYLREGESNKNIDIKDVPIAFNISSLPISKLAWSIAIFWWFKDKSFTYGSKFIAVWQEGNKAVGTIYLDKKSIESTSIPLDISNTESFKWLSGGIITDEKGGVLGVLSSVISTENNEFVIMVIALIPDQYKN